ncbi:MAG: RNA-binding domain-containing protein [Eubacteriales bacterium]|jgi:ATP-dependent DNA helicase RecG
MSLKDKVLELCLYTDEQEWFEFKENWFQPETLGEYVSALSNAAAFRHKETAYFIWGINDKTHEIVGTSFNPYCEYNNEPYQNFLARNLSPSINFSFEELEIDGKRIVVLLIPPAEGIPTAFREKRFIRIGSSKRNIKDYPKREIQLFKILDGRIETIETTPAKYQDLSFQKLFGYYGSKGILLKRETFEKNLLLRTKTGEYNVMAQLLSDDSHIPLRVSIFEGETKASKLFSVREFGYDCLLYSLDNLLRYGDVLNIIQADEENRLVERKDVPLFDNKAFREAIINAILHNFWVSGNEPMISVFSNRIEILSRGTLPPSQTKEGFFLGESIPVNEKLSEIFLQLHISEKSGRGVPKIVETYGREAVTFRENSIVVTIPFNRIHQVGKKLGNKNTGDVLVRKPLNERRKLILSEMRDNPNITMAELQKILGISGTAVDNNIAFLRKNGYIERIGSRRGGYWRVIADE